MEVKKFMPNYTNKLNLPIAIYRAVVNQEDRTPQENVYYVTEFIKSVREIKLTRLHWNEISIDISDCINTLIGRCVHKVMELADPENAEKKIEAVTDGIKLVGCIDKYDYEKLTIIDYKTCRKSHKEFEDWYLQGMLYAYMMLISEHIKTKQLQFIGLVKDSVIARGDPTVIPYIYDIKDSDYDFIAEYVSKKAKLLKSNDIPLCSDSEKWKTSDSWALKAKPDSTRAIKVLDHEPTPEEKGKYIVEFRKGECKKCIHYCTCRKFCQKENV